MGEDLSAGIKIAIVLVILASILASVFSILTISKNMTTQSVDDLQSSLYAFQNMRWEDYNLRTISGNQVQVVVRSAIENNIAVVVNTVRNKEVSVLYGIPIKGFTKNSVGNFATGTSTGNATTKQFNESIISGDLHYDVNNSYFVGAITDSNEASYTPFSYVRNINDNSSTYYIDPTLKFNSYIIRDDAGTLIGVLFDQVQKG